MKTNRKILIVSAIVVLIYFILGLTILNINATIDSGIFFYIFFPIEFTILFFGWGGFNNSTIYVALALLFMVMWILLFIFSKFMYRFKSWFS